MRRIFTFLFLVIALPCFGQVSGLLFNLTYPYYNLSATNRTVWLSPLSTPSAGNGLNLNDKFLTNSGSGVFVVSNVAAGLWQADIKAPPTLTSFRFLIPTNNPGTFDVTNFIVTDPNTTYPVGGVAWTIGASDGRYIKTQGLNQATNLPAATNLLGTPDGTNLAWVYIPIQSNSLAGGNDTNNLYVTLCETAAANQHYTFKTGSSPGRYTNAVNDCVVVNSDDLAGDGMTWIITNVANGQIVGTADPTPASSLWYILPSLNNSVTVSVWGTNQNPYFTFGGFSISSNQDLWVDPTNGNDVIWFRGHPELPLKTLQAALSASKNFDIIHLAPGTYQGGVSTTLKQGTKLLGAGRFSTVIADDGLRCLNIYSNNITLENLSCGATYIGNIGFPPVTNIFISNVGIIGKQDGLFVRNGYWNLVGLNSSFASKWDAWADYSASGGYTSSLTNSYAAFTNCTFIDDNAIAGTQGYEAIVLGPGKVAFVNCHIKTRQTRNGHAECVFCDPTALGTNGYAEFIGCSFDCANTNVSGTAWAIHNDMGVRIILSGCLMDQLSIYDPSNQITTAGGYIGNLLIKSNALSTIPTINFGDNYYWSSNGTGYLISSSPSGTLTTNPIAPINGAGLFSGTVVTNGNSYAVTVSNQWAVDIKHALVASNATASRIAMFDAANQITNAVASGAVPINADGSATVFSQVNALAPGLVVTNGESQAITVSNQWRVDITHAFVASNATALRLAAFDAAGQLTNATTGSGVSFSGGLVLSGTAGAGSDTTAWHNSGDNYASPNFLGTTTDGNDLILKAGNRESLRLFGGAAQCVLFNAGGSSPNAIGGGTTTSYTISGGASNYINSSFPVVAGGFHNRIENGDNATISGGIDNLITTGTDNSSVIAGGRHNTLNTCDYGSIGGGMTNSITGAGQGGIFTGAYNSISNFCQISVILGGMSNVVGGINGMTTGTILGGTNNQAGDSRTIAGGTRAKALHHGAMVLTDSQEADQSSSTSDEATLRFQNGIRLLGGAITGNGLNITNVQSSGVTTWSATTGNITIPASTTIFIPLNNNASNCIAFTSDASGGTRSLVSSTTLFQNMRVVSSANPGTSKCTITLFTNGVAASLTCGPSGGTTASDTSHTDKIVGGVEAGWQIVIASAATAVKYVISVESVRLQ